MDTVPAKVKQVYDQVEKIRSKQISTQAKDKISDIETMISKERDLIDGRIDVVLFKIDGLTSLAQKLSNHFKSLGLEKDA